MRSVVRQYTNEMKKRFGYYAIWNPGVPLEVGDIGTFKKNELTRRSNLKERGINFKIRPDKTKIDLNYSTSRGVSESSKLEGSAPFAGSKLAEMEAGLFVEFSKANATLFKANNTTSPSISDIIKLSEQVSKLYLEGKWDAELVIITELIHAETATIIISNKSNVKFDLKANANIKASSFDIADAKFKFSCDFPNGLESHSIAVENLTPLFKAMTLKTKKGLPPILDIRTAFGSDAVLSESEKTQLKNNIYLDYISEEDME